MVPAQHYFMGGVHVDSNSQTTLPNLFALGETACNGVHGKNRLASNSLLESLVFAQRAARLVSGRMAQASRVRAAAASAGASAAAVAKSMAQAADSKAQAKAATAPVQYAVPVGSSAAVAEKAKAKEAR